MTFLDNKYLKLRVIFMTLLLTAERVCVAAWRWRHMKINGHR